MLSKHQYKGEILNFNKITRDKDLPELPENIVEEAFNLSTGEGTVISGDEERRSRSRRWCQCNSSDDGEDEEKNHRTNKIWHCFSSVFF